MNATNASEIASTEKGMFPKQKWDICRFSMTVAMTAVILLANLAVTAAYAIMRKCDRHKIPNYCFFHQSLSDMVVGVAFLLYELYTSSHIFRQPVPTPFEYHMVRYSKVVCKPFTVLLCVTILIINTSDR